MVGGGIGGVVIGNRQVQQKHGRRWVVQPRDCDFLCAEWEVVSVCGLADCLIGRPTARSRHDVTLKVGRQLAHTTPPRPVCHHTAGADSAASMLAALMASTSAATCGSRGS